MAFPICVDCSAAEVCAFRHELNGNGLDPNERNEKGRTCLDQATALPNCALGETLRDGRGTGGSVELPPQ